MYRQSHGVPHRHACRLRRPTQPSIRRIPGLADHPCGVRPTGRRRRNPQGGSARHREVGMGRVAARLLIGIGTAVLVLAGCSSGGGDAKVKVAEHRVSDKQKALSDAQSQLTAKTTAFCKSSSTYITALDRYGDVLHQTAPTVGDVKDAGSDLAQPREDVMSSGQAVTD